MAVGLGVALVALAVAMPGRAIDHTPPNELIPLPLVCPDALSPEYM